jgi:hypothetical protein
LHLPQQVFSARPRDLRLMQRDLRDRRGGLHVLQRHFEERRAQLHLLQGGSEKKLAEQLLQESEATFTGLASGTAIKVIVTARNDSGGESGPSEPGSGTVP